MSSADEHILLKNFSFAETSNISIPIMDVEYELVKVSEEIMKLVKKRQATSTEKYAGLDTGSAMFKVQPVFYDLPALIKLNQELIIGPRSKMEILADIPIKFRLQAEVNSDSITLDELKDEHLKQSNYGPAFSGIFCNAIYSPVYTTPDSIKERNYCAALPLVLENNHTQWVTVTRVLIQMEKLMLFLMGDKLISNRVAMKIKNTSEADIIYQDNTITQGLRKVLENIAPLEASAMGKILGISISGSRSLEYGF
jgi:hypothetical protein